MKSLHRHLFFILIMVVTTLCFAQDDVAITVTNSDLGLVKEKRILSLEKGIHSFNLEDIPTKIDPTSVLIESNGNTFNVIEQNFEYDLISVDKVLAKTIDQDIMVVHPDQGTIAGRLLSSSPANLILLDDQDNLQIVPRNKEQKIYLKDYSKKKSSFITKPTLVWKVDAAKKGEHKAQISYLSEGLNWKADYVGKLNEDDTQIGLACWITLDNRCGKSFQNARLKLMAGDLSRVDKRMSRPVSGRGLMDLAVEPAFEEKAFFEYHLYTLQRPTDIRNNQVKQIQLFAETKSKITKSYRVDSRSSNKVAAFVSMKNSKDQNLGFPLPAGTIRLYKTDDEDLEFIGENSIKHTAKDEKLDIEVGKAFDVVAERKVLSTQRPTKRSQQQTIEYSIRNHKESDVDVDVFERLSSYQESKLLSSNFKPIEKRADYIKFKIPVEANSDTILKFEYKTNW